MPLSSVELEHIPSYDPKETSYRMSRKFDLITMKQVSINTAYKKVADKVRPMDLRESDGSKPLEDSELESGSLKEEEILQAFRE